MDDLLQRPRLRDNRGRGPFELYPIGQIPRSAIVTFSKHFTYLYLTGRTNLSGSDWGDAFASGIGGLHLDSPLGLADIVYDDSQCWSAKTVHAENPHTVNKVRIITGRCSPDYSYGITDPHENPQRTGTAVLSIINERINIAKDQYEPLRAVICVRNFPEFKFALFEYDMYRYVAADYEWKPNNNGNLEGRDANGRHCFTWQPHGSQFTVLYDVPPSVIKFSVQQPPVLDFNEMLEQVGFDDSWVTIL